jgi:SpoVK/Ycf46/Vps4 family AAA+-type ATPase
VLSKRPSTLVIDDFFLFDPSSPTASAILNSIQKLSGQRVCAVLCCRQSSSIPPEIRSPTQLLGVIEIGALTEQQRYDVFRECARSSGCVLDDIVDWRDIMKYCSGYTIGDMRRLFASYLSHSSHTTSFDVHHFLDAVKSNSSACSDIPLEFPTDRLDSLAGFCEIRDRLEQLIVRPVLCPMQYQAMGMCIPKGLLICGPKGSGKTSFVRAAAGSAGAALITVTPSLLYRRYLGESEAAVKSIYATARSRSPCVVFLDDTDALLASRNSDASDSVGERVLAALLTEIDGLEGSNNDLVLTVGATSRSDAIDPALARPGRLETCLHLHLPSFDDRLQILASLLKRMNVHTAVDLQSLTLLTEGMAVESLLSLCHRAAHSCMENGTSNTIVPADFSRALEKLNIETRK